MSTAALAFYSSIGNDRFMVDRWQNTKMRPRKQGHVSTLK